MRVPLPTDFVARLSSASKDARMVNSLKETKVDGVQIKKRPGLTSTGYNYSGIQGVLGLGGFLYLVYDDKFELSAYTGTPLPPYIYIGDLVGGYYAMIDNPPTPPGGGDAYWSISPPGADRFRGHWYGQASSGAIATFPTTPNYLIGDVAASAAAAAKVWVEKVIGVNLSGIAALDVDDTWYPDVVAATFTFNTPTVYTYPAGYVGDSIQMNVNGKISFLSPAYPTGWPSGASWTSPATYDEYVGVVRRLKTTTSFTVTSSGTTATLTSSALIGLGPYHWIKISGCTEPEYNGTFFAVQPLDPVFPWLSANEWKFTLPGTPSASPATGTKSLQYYGAL